MLINKIGYSYNDITLVPETISDINSRSECDPFIENFFLPIFTAPMASVVNEQNINEFYDNGIIAIIPRNINIESRIKLMNEQHWVALSLKEFEDLFTNNYLDRIDDFRTHYFICVDIANGHMKSLYNICKLAKKNAIAGKYKLTIMTGNIANPKTYEWICNFNDNNWSDINENIIDYIRIGIGGGCGCITTSNVSAHYPQATLIDECFKIKNKISSNRNYYPKIVADGGIRNYDHVIKALALGADYVMIGSLFAQCIESAGEKTAKSLSEKLSLRFPIERYKDFRIDQKGNFTAYYTDEYIKEASKTWEESLINSPDKEHAKESYKRRIKDLKEEKFIGPINIKFFGMASADGQKSINGKKTKTSEGITKWLPVKYTLKGWTENMISYLRSAMSYTNAKILKEFIGKPELIINSISEINAVNK